MDKKEFPVKQMAIGGIDIAEYAIVYPKDGNVSLQKAARCLSRMIQKATGQELTVMDDTQSASHEIVLDRTGRDTEKLEQMRASIGNDGYVLLAAGCISPAPALGGPGTASSPFWRRGWDSDSMRKIIL